MSFVDMSSVSTPMATALSLPAQAMAGQVGELECPWRWLTSHLQIAELGDRVDRLERLINERMDSLQSNMASMIQEVLISEIMQERYSLTTY
jgi:hypothetical protein